MQWVAPIWLLVVVGQRVGPVFSRALFGRVGFWLFWLGSVLAAAFVLVTRRLSPLDWFFGLVMLLPIIVTWTCLIREKERPKTSVLLAHLAAGAGLVVLTVAASGPLAMHNGYPAPLASAGIVMAALSLLSILVPPDVPDMDRAAAQAVGPLLVLAAPVLVVGFSIFVSMRADAAYPDAACMADTHGARFEHSYWISPRRMFFDNDYKGIITHPYLLLGPDGGVAERHWSFRKMDFVTNESRAFSMPIPRWFKENDAKSRCVLSRAG